MYLETIAELQFVPALQKLFPCIGDRLNATSLLLVYCCFCVDVYPSAPWWVVSCAAQFVYLFTFYTTNALFYQFYASISVSQDHRINSRLLHPNLLAFAVSTPVKPNLPTQPTWYSSRISISPPTLTCLQGRSRWRRTRRSIRPNRLVFLKESPFHIIHKNSITGSKRAGCKLREAAASGASKW